MTSTSLWLNDIHYYYVNTTETDSENMRAYNISNIVGKNFANSFLNCYLFYDGYVNWWENRLSSFVDFNDVYTSMLFNLLANSLKIRSLSEEISLAEEEDPKDYVTMVQASAELLRIFIDFESSTASSLEEVIAQN